MRFADPTVCVRHKVCWASVPRAGIAAHHVETITGSGQCHEVFAWSSRGHTIGHLFVSWNCRVQDFGAHVVQHTATQIRCKLQVLFFSRVSADALEQKLYLNHV